MKKKKTFEKNQRMFVVFIFVIFIFIGLMGNYLRLIVKHGEEYRTDAERRWFSKEEVTAKRGKILDANGNEVAVSGNVFRADLDLETLREDGEDTKDRKAFYNIDEVAESMSKILGMTKEEILDIVNSTDAEGNPQSFAQLKRKIEASQAEQLQKLKDEKNVRAVIISEDTKRYYPNNDFASKIIGHVNGDDKGLTGVELYYDKYLSGISGQYIQEEDGYSNPMPFTKATYYPPVQGSDVQLSIDNRIQRLAEKIAEKGKKDTAAESVYIVVSDPNTGAIVAMASTGGYDLNNPWISGKSFDELQASWRNNIVSDSFELGSIFKPILAAAALENKAIANDQVIVDCKGSVTVSGIPINCDSGTPHGPETIVDILRNSCNVGCVKVAELLGADKLHQYIDKVGFGQATGIDIEGESEGIVLRTDEMGPVELATISYGHANTSTMIQYITAFNAIANGGTYISPHILKEIKGYNSDGSTFMQKTFDTGKKKEIISPEVATTVRQDLIKVVDTPRGMQIPGYQFAGKTGTAMATEKGQYVAGKYISSFASMLPADKPQYTMMVTVKYPKPEAYYASQTAMPIAKELWTAMIAELGIKPTLPVPATPGN